jgi:hypothetical protein
MENGRELAGNRDPDLVMPREWHRAGVRGGSLVEGALPILRESTTGSRFMLALPWSPATTRTAIS